VNNAMLEKMLVCPVCHTELPLTKIRAKGKGSCISCRRAFTYHNGVYDMTPMPPPDDDVLAKWALWEKLQANGLISYQMAPEASCSIAGRADVAAWKKFLNLKPGSYVLDVGCGPIDIPEYLKGWQQIQAIGIDPLQPSFALSEMMFVKGIGEYLPFRDESFDSVILATSLDHVLSPLRVLSEARRCLKPDGSALMWLSQQVGLKTIFYTNLIPRIIRIISPIIQSARRAKDTTKPLWQKINESLEVPKGAIDPYHFRHDDEAEIRGWLSSLGFYIVRKSVYIRQDIFLELRLQRDSD